MDEKIKKLLAKGEKEGKLTFREIEEEFPEDSTSPEQIEGFFHLLEKEGIDIVEEGVGEEISPRGEDSISRYLQEIGKTPLLTPEEEREYGKRIRESKKIIREKVLELVKMVEKNPPLLSRAYRKGVEKKDLKQAKNKFKKLKKVLNFLAGLKEEDLNCLKEDKEKAKQSVKKLKEVKKEYEKYRDRMIEANLRLVVSFAKKYTGRGVPFLDLIQEGNIGLSRAVDKFDYRRGNRFSTYASWWIRQSLSRAIADQSRTIRIPVHITELVKKVNKVGQELEQDLHRSPTPEEIAEKAGLPPDKVEGVQKTISRSISMDTPIGDDEDSVLLELIENPHASCPFRETALRFLEKAIKRLVEAVEDSREKEILKLRFGLENGKDYTLQEIGERYGVTRERIRQIEAKILEDLRPLARKLGLEEYLSLLTGMK